MSFSDYINWWHSKSWIWKLVNFLRWRFSYLRAFFLGGPCAGERLLLNVYGDVEYFKKPRKVYCSSCGWGGTTDEVGKLYPYIQDIIETLKPGEEVPAGICPHCDGILYLKRKKK